MLIVFDLEATCWETREETNQNTAEIIQIGAVKLNLAQETIIDTFDVFVRPQLVSDLSNYCVNLTGIKYDQLKTAEYFEQVYPKFVDFCGSKHKHTLVAWGAYDGRQVEKHCLRHNLEYKLPGHYINASLLFKERFGLSKKVGLATAVKLCELEFVGNAHDAFADALNTARVFAYMFGIKQLK